MIGCLSMARMRSPAVSPASAAGAPSTMLVTVTPVRSSMRALRGLMRVRTSTSKNAAKMMFANAPAEKIASCSETGLLKSFFSSGSTNAAGITGTIIPRNANPEDLTLSL